MESSQDQKIESRSSIPLSEFIYSEFGNAYFNKYGEKKFYRNDFRLTTEVDKFRMEKNNIGVYRSAFSYNSTDPYTSDYFGSFYMDFDDEEDINKAREDALFVIWKMQLKTSYNLPQESFRIYFSGKKGFHIIIPWQYFGIVPSHYLHDYFRMMAEDLSLKDEKLETLDMSVYEKRRLFRLENSQHQDTGLFKIPLTLGQLSSMKDIEILELATNNFLIKYPEPVLIPQANKKFNEYIQRFEDNKLRKYTKFKNPKPLGYIPDNLQRLIDEGPVQGSRNNSMAILTSFYRDEGMSYEEVYQTIYEWVEGDLTGPDRIRENEIEATVKSVYYSDKHYGRTAIEQIIGGS